MANLLARTALFFCLTAAMGAALAIPYLSVPPPAAVVASRYYAALEARAPHAVPSKGTYTGD